MRRAYEIAFNLGARTDPSLRRNFGRANKHVAAFRGNLARTARRARIMATAIAGAATAVMAGGIAMANNFANTADEIHKASLKAGVHTDTLQELRYVASQMGLEQNDLQRALERTNQRVGMAREGHDRYNESLLALGISQKDLEDGTVTTEDAFKTAISTLHDMEDSQKRAALAGDFFGTQLSRKLLPVIEEGGEEMEKLIAESHELNHVIGEDGIKAGVLWSDTMDKLKTAMRGVWNTVAARALPIFQKFLDYGIEHLPRVQKFLNNAMETAGRVIGEIGSIGSRVFSSIKGAIADVTPGAEGLGITFQDVRGWLVGIWEKAQPWIDWFIDDAIPKAVGVIYNLYQGARRVYDTVTEWIGTKNIIYGIVGALVAYRTILTIAAGVTAVKAAWVGIYTVVTKTAAAAVWIKNAALKVYAGVMWLAVGAGKAFAVVAGAIGAPVWLVVAAIAAAIAIGYLLWQNWDWISEKAGELWARVKESFAGIRANVVEAFQGIRDRATEIWGTIAGSVRGAINTIISAANTMIGGINNLSIEIPAWVKYIPGVPEGMAGGTIGFNVATIPELAKGGIVTGPTLAMVGEGGEDEVVSPLSRLKDFLSPSGETTNVNREDSHDRVNITFAPNISIGGNAGRAEVEKAVRLSFGEFKKLMKRYKLEEGRLNFS